MKRARKKHNAVIKRRGGGGGGRGDRTIAELASEFGIHPNGIYNWKKQLLDGAASVFEGGGGARACWERGVSKSVVLLTGDRGFESFSLQQRVCKPPVPLGRGAEPEMASPPIAHTADRRRFDTHGTSLCQPSSNARSAPRGGR